MATAPALMTMEQYLSTSYSPDVDFVDGEIEERNLGESEHAELQWIIAGTLYPLQKRLRITGRTELRMRVSKSRVRICDLALLSADTPYEKVARTPPLVCIEIMSREDRLSRAIRVLEDYRSMGVPNIWLIDPQEELAYTFNAEGLHQQQDLILQAAGSNITLDVNAIFAELKRNEAEK